MLKGIRTYLKESAMGCRVKQEWEVNGVRKIAYDDCLNGMCDAIVMARLGDRSFYDLGVSSDYLMIWNASFMEYGRAN